ncbi:hypothetical protein C5167_028803 [Papaver somniferum]|nr:hypothetical protein C5167_028803 [Papaver somniferum]
MMLNLELLRDEGVPQSNISRFLPQQPRSFTMLTGMSKSTWEKKMNAYKGWGWSEDVTMNAFKQQPGDF